MYIQYTKNGYFKPFLLHEICPQFYLDLYNYNNYILQVVIIVVKRYNLK